MGDMGKPANEETPVTRAELEAECQANEWFAERVRKFLDESKEGDTFFRYRYSTGFRALSGHASSGLIRVSPDGTRERICLMSVMS